MDIELVLSSLEVDSWFVFEVTEEDFRCLIRLAVEFDEFLKAIPIDIESFEWQADSAFAGVSSFQLIGRDYSSFWDKRVSSVRWESLQMDNLPSEFKRIFADFAGAPDFALRCRLLLDLFKLQLIYFATRAF